MSEKRKRIWKHNGFQGSIAMAIQAMIAIRNSNTASPEAKEGAKSIQGDLYVLAHELKNNRQD